jgi:hypothetical protein
MVLQGTEEEEKFTAITNFNRLGPPCCDKTKASLTWEDKKLLLEVLKE